VFEVRPLTTAIGAEVHGIDCAAPLSDETIAELRAAWLKWLVLFFPGQNLTSDQQIAFANRFGEVTEGHPVEKLNPEHPEVQPITSDKDRTNFWHTDVTFMADPPMASMLYSVEVPDVGGDTMWINTRAGYDALGAPLQGFCDDLVAWHYSEYYAHVVNDGGGNTWHGKKLEKLSPVQHPVVRVHPETGRRNLFVNPGFTVGVKDLPGPQGNAVLKMLYDHMIAPEFLVRYRWSAGTLAFWDNRTTMHYGIYDYGEARRVMHRVILRGDRPRGPVSS
jgi:alpha-ketoglutarate-dependent taurine dioxygenase